MTKSKQNNHYRKSIAAAEGSRYKRCKYCRHKTVMELKGISGKAIGHGHRCSIIGLENSNRYAIQDDNVCDGWMKA